ncbi:hypothetical protein BX600DRAFT_474339 [Xylariales sp. PMI_506]|nr:hypothetical protein BX600DRAFT_474339 [Xylariales sp. PMI_506]
MAVDGTPRSVADATRFTSNTPHVNAKARKPQTGSASQSPAASGSSSAPSSATPSTSAPTAASSASSPGRQSPVSSATPPSAGKPSPRRPAPASTSAMASRAANATPETLEEKVRRLRAAHLAARNHEMSRMDRVISTSRRYMDAAHRITVLSLIGFSGLALIVTAYATVDMMIYNRKRRNEFFALQKQFESDSLEAARLAYMSGKATPEQATMVEDATERAKLAGVPLPNILNPQATVVEQTERVTLPDSLPSSVKGVEEPVKKGLSSWLFGGLKKEDAAAGAHELSLEKSDTFRSLAEQSQAGAGVDKQIQPAGGSLDQIGSNAGEKKKGWFW